LGRVDSAIVGMWFVGAEAYSAEGGSGILWGRGLGVGSFQGYAIQQGARYRLGKVVEGVEVKHERVSPYYYSEGAPFIFRGQQKIEGLVRYRVWRGWRGRVGGYYRRDNVSERRVQAMVWRVGYIGQEIGHGPWVFRREYRYVQRYGVEKIEQHQIQGVGGFGRERTTIEGQGVSFLGRRGVELINGSLGIRGYIGERWRWGIQRGYMDVWAMIEGRQRGERYWRRDGEVWYEWGAGGVGVEGLLYRGKGAERWQRNVSLEVRQKLARGLEARLRVGYGQMREQLSWYGMLLPRSQDYWQGETQIAYRW